MNTTIIIVLSILASIVAYYFVLNQSSIMAKFQENLTIIDSGLTNVEILPECQNMTPIKLYALLGNDLERATQIMLDNGIPDAALKSRGYYPKIASLLMERGIIKSCSVE